MEVTLIRSNRKSIGIEIKPDLSIIVRAPKRVSKREIERLLREKEDWINRTIEKIKKQELENERYKEPPLTAEDIQTLADQALEYIPKRVEVYANFVGVNYGRITIRNQKTRWGSCSSKGNLNFNCLLMLTPKEVIDYVVVHELCHRKEMNHSKAFWAEVEAILPNYRQPKKWLKENGNAIMQRMIEGR